MPFHGDECARAGKWYRDKGCQQFSTDGTAMGALIAHMYGTTSEREIRVIQEWEYQNDRDANLTGMDAEEDDWNCECPEGCDVHGY